MTMRIFILGTLLLTVALDSVCAQSTPNLPVTPTPALTSGTGFNLSLAPVCQDSPRLWVSGDYMLYWVKKAPLPAPLVTTDPTNGATATAGGLADPTTQVLMGNADIGYHVFSGTRLGAGYRLSDNIAIEGSVFFLRSQSQSQSVGADVNGNPFLFRPFVNVDTGNQNAGSIVALSGFNTGQVQLNTSLSLWGADALVAATLWRSRTASIDGIVGFRYVDLLERLDILDNRTIAQAGFANFGAVNANAGDVFTFQDGFHTRNQFYGGVLGLRGEKLLGNWALSGSARVALGDTHQTVNIQGSTTYTAAGAAPTTLPGGILALPSNTGIFTHNAFSVVPEVSGQISYDVRSWLRLSAGYNFLYWTHVVRPGDQISTTVSASQLPSSPSYAPGTTLVPAPPHNSSDFWAHGVNFGVTLRY